MNSKTPPDQTCSQDGFDLIDYPCDFAFKALCRVDKSAAESASEVMRQLVLAHVPESSLIETHVNQSRTGKFESVTLTVHLTAREELEAIYRSVSASPLVVMTL
ncbi:MAG: DUF493 domain-containing protein [Gammaproteobacteria bacterium]|nr:DUF493 domain-containing protein [Gammaproteobacteria bacterium]